MSGSILIYCHLSDACKYGTLKALLIAAINLTHNAFWNHCSCLKFFNVVWTLLTRTFELLLYFIIGFRIIGLQHFWNFRNTFHKNLFNFSTNSKYKNFCFHSFVATFAINSNIQVCWKSQKSLHAVDVQLNDKAQVTYLFTV